MKYLEPKIMELMTYEAKTTTDIIIALYGDDVNTEKARTSVHEALVALEEDGKIDSRLTYSVPKHCIVRWWALPGGQFPANDPIADAPVITERIKHTLKDGPKTTADIFDDIFFDTEREDPNASMRLRKALYRLKKNQVIERCNIPMNPGVCTPYPAWRLRE